MRGSHNPAPWKWVRIPGNGWTLFGPGGEAAHVLAGREDGSTEVLNAILTVDAETGQLIVRDATGNRFVPFDPEQPDAQLMAAAPVLLARLQGLLAWGALARLLDPGISASIKGDPVWTDARDLLEALGGAA